MKIQFYDEIADDQLLFAVIAARYKGSWVFCKHKERDTWELPGGHREKESIEACARRELFEETGAEEFTLYPVCAYSCLGKTRVKESSDKHKTYGMLYYAQIKSFTPLSAKSEMQYREFFDDIDKIPAWTYPQIQPQLLQQVLHYIDEKK